MATAASVSVSWSYLSAISSLQRARQCQVGMQGLGFGV